MTARSLIVPLVLAVAGAALAACGDSTSSASSSGTGGPIGATVQAPSSASAAPVPVAEPSGLPFTFQGGGQGGSPPFTVPSTGSYKVEYHLSADANGAACSMSIALSHGSDNVTVVDQVSVAPRSPKSATMMVTLAAGAWRAIEGGGCAWTLTVGG